ncbi:aspartyl/asparaginyl beta-hydroxylase domain-containing protein [Rosenbergiella sp. S61]|uniref:Aspartyl/asparaginyl beta-hydroxylase domain-containing protein n=1 Tax=Rosenbergiella gaditana TaxID=2726987 RepID=A0ABS5SYY8_9GAMM|nr:aspartyl/asparaginyl beta-hydroxylase domain-containing protein [Rosenbergiella gaditana]
MIIFDNFYKHEMRNDTDKLPKVLFIDIYRPMIELGTFIDKLFLNLITANPYVE